MLSLLCSFLSDAATAATANSDHAKVLSETVKNWLEAFAWACAGAFFVYKTFSGYLISNLSLSISCQRTKAGSEHPVTDYLVVTANLKKGDRGAVSLHDLQAQVSPTVQGESSCKPLAGARRLTSRRSPSTGTFQIVNKESTTAPLLNLPPGEETTFSNWFIVPSASPCTVEVTVLGGWRWHSETRYQWRASMVSLPVQASTD